MFAPYTAKDYLIKKTQKKVNQMYRVILEKTPMTTKRKNVKQKTAEDVVAAALPRMAAEAAGIQEWALTGWTEKPLTPGLHVMRYWTNFHQQTYNYTVVRAVKQDDGIIECYKMYGTGFNATCELSPQDYNTPMFQKVSE